MVNWVTRRDLSEAAKGGAGFFALLMLAVAALFAGAWWWVSGRRLTAEPTMPRWVRVLWKGCLFVAAFALAYADGWVGSAGAVAVFAMAGFGWWLMATPDEVRRPSQGRQHRRDRAAASAPPPSIRSESS